MKPVEVTNHPKGIKSNKDVIAFTFSLNNLCRINNSRKLHMNINMPWPIRENGKEKKLPPQSMQQQALIL